MANSRNLKKIKDFVRNPKDNNPISRLKAQNEQLKDMVDDLLKTNHFVHTELTFLKETILANQHKIEKTDDRLSDAIQKITLVNQPAVAPTSDASKKELFADNHILDSFYVKFEDTFRGGEADIRERLEFYLDRFVTIRDQSKKYPVLDIGCGRGEFIDMMTDNDISVIGLDLNKAMVDRVIEKGGKAELVDALTFLRKQKTSSLSAITGFHIVEHIPFDQLIDIFNECYRVLRPGGFTLFETPNPETLVVGSCSFYMDPSHLHPIPPALLEFAMGTCGFDSSEIIRLHPRNELKDTKNELLRSVAERVFGPQDYAVISIK